MYGKAIYFAVNADYSCGGVYKYTVPNQKDEYEVFFADVVIGKEADFPIYNKDTGEWKEPPFIADTNRRYDSVKGNT